MLDNLFQALGFPFLFLDLSFELVLQNEVLLLILPLDEDLRFLPVFLLLLELVLQS